MKKLITILVLGLTSQFAIAGELKRPCWLRDYQQLSEALSEGKIVEGAKFAKAVSALLQQEMGPQCLTVMSDSVIPTISIPGDNLSNYELSDTNSAYRIGVKTSVERNAIFVQIKMLR